MEGSEDGFKKPTFLKKNLQLDGLSSDMSMSQSNSYQISQFGFRFKKPGIKVNTHGVVNENTGDTYGFINPEEILIKEQIGYGAGGSVHLAIHEPSDTRLAIKNVNIYDKEKRHQLMNELSSLQEGLQCDYLVQFFGAYYDEGRVKLVLEYMDCGSLRSFMDVIKQQIPDQIPMMPEYVIGKSTFQILKALNFLHKQRHQIHRDVKPENVLVNSFGEFKMTDFGISKQLLNTLNICKSFVGTIAYMSPERMNSEEYSYPSDIWSLGLIVFEMAMGQH
jgi:serine/threonine protein kinase